MFSKQTVYCNACGKKMEIEPHKLIGRLFRVCSMQCNREMEWRQALSSTNSEYRPDPEPHKET